MSHLATSTTAVDCVAGRAEFADPPKIGRHEPDLTATADDRLIIGEAKTGPDLSDATSREQLQDFSTHRDAKGERATFWLVVPKGWRDLAFQAIVDAGGEVHAAVDVLEVDVPGAPKPPPS